MSHQLWEKKQLPTTVHEESTEAAREVYSQLVVEAVPAAWLVKTQTQAQEEYCEGLMALALPLQLELCFENIARKDCAEHRAVSLADVRFHCRYPSPLRMTPRDRVVGLDLMWIFATTHAHCPSSLVLEATAMEFSYLIQSFPNLMHGHHKMYEQRHTHR